LPSDFRAYYRCGLKIAEEGFLADGCRGPYLLRAISYTLPIQFLFGNSHLAFELVNVFLLSLSSWLFFLFLRNCASAHIAAIGLVFFNLSPDLWYMMTLTSQDVVGTFWLSLIFYALSRLTALLPTTKTSGLRSPILWSVLIGIGLFFLYLQQSYYLFILVSLVLFTIYLGVRASFPQCFSVSSNSTTSPARQMTLALVFCCALPFAIASSGQKVLKANFTERQLGNSNFLRYVSAMDVTGANRHYQMMAWRLSYYPKIPVELQNKIALKKLLHEISADPFEWLNHLIRKNYVLALPNGYLNFSVRPASDPGVGRVNSDWRACQIFLVYFITFSICVLAALSVLLGLNRVTSPPELFLYIFSLLNYCAILFLTESQARYDVFLVFPFSFLAASSISKCLKIEEKELSNGILANLRGILFGTFGLSIALVLIYASVSLIRNSDLTLKNQSGFKETPQTGAPDVLTPRFLHNNFKRLVVAYPGHQEIRPGSIISVEKSFVTNSNQLRYLRFFVSNAQISNKFSPWEAADLETRVFVNDRLVGEVRLNTLNVAQFFEISDSEILKGPNLNIRFEVENHALIDPIEGKKLDYGMAALEYIDFQ
ncbi:MAG: hypothetical protein KDD53_08955, partial [Bdellovibrionales bacterium]|nr:hypothetical protein [Bdellovibrionales bacterium]